MPQMTVYTCDVCGTLIDESQVIGYHLSLALTGTSQPSRYGGQSYACQQPGHAFEAAQQLLTRLEQQRQAHGNATRP